MALENNYRLYYKENAKIAYRNQGSLQKQFGSMADAISIVANLKCGMSWEDACYPPPELVSKLHNKGARGIEVPIDQSWLAANKALFEKWVENGVPTHKDRTMTQPRVRYLKVIATPDGKVWGVQQDGTRVLIPESNAKEVEVAPEAVELKPNVPGAMEEFDDELDEPEVKKPKSKKEW